MSLFIEEEGNIKLDFDTEEIAALVIDAALELADCPYEAEINLLLTENAQIHEMNLEQRGIDRPTDVLSFPMIEYEEPGDFSVIDEESAEAFNPESGSGTDIPALGALPCKWQPGRGTAQKAFGGVCGGRSAYLCEAAE